MRYVWGSGRESFQEWACFCSWGNYGVLPQIGLSLDLSQALDSSKKSERSLIPSHGPTKPGSPLKMAFLVVVAVA